MIKLLLLALILTVSAPGLGYDQLRQELTTWIQQEMDTRGIEGLSLALVDAGEVIWVQGFGWADREAQIPAGPETIYPLGSISKLFTATAIMQLMQAGLVDLDAELGDYLPQFSIQSHFLAEPITIGSLLSHHSGLPSTLYKGFLSHDPEPWTQTLEQLSQTYLAYPPYTIMNYSNIGYTLLGHLVAQVSDREFSQYIEDQIFAPLGMSSSGLGPLPRMNPNLTKTYRRGQEVVEPAIGPAPAGEFYSSVWEMAQFIKMVLSPDDYPVLSAKTLQSMWQPQNLDVALDLDREMGLGWFLGRRDLDPLGMLVWHGGDRLYSHSQMFILPQEGLGVVVLANTAGAKPLVDQVAVRLLTKAWEIKRGENAPNPPALDPSPRLRLTRPERDALAGTYATSMLDMVPVTSTWLGLEIKFLGNRFRLLPHADGTFSLRFLLFGLIPIKHKDLADLRFSFIEIQGEQLVLIHQGASRGFFGAKIEPQPIPDAWRKRTGRYEILNLGTDVTVLDEIQLKVVGEYLVLSMGVPLFKDQGLERANIALDPLNDTQAITMGLGQMYGETVEIRVIDGEERLFFSGYEARRVP